MAAEARGIDGKTELSEQEVSKWKSLDACLPLPEDSAFFQAVLHCPFLTPDCNFVLNEAFYGRFLSRITSSAEKCTGDIHA